MRQISRKREKEVIIEYKNIRKRKKMCMAWKKKTFFLLCVYFSLCMNIKDDDDDCVLEFGFAGYMKYLLENYNVNWSILVMVKASWVYNFILGRESACFIRSNSF